MDASNKNEFVDAINAAADLGEPCAGFNQVDLVVLCAVAYHQPIDLAGLKDIFAKEISRDVLNRLRYLKLIANGLRYPRHGAPHTFVTTQELLAMFDLQSLRELPDKS